jgi:hypothetical protein
MTCLLVRLPDHSVANLESADVRHKPRIEGADGPRSPSRSAPRMSFGWTTGRNTKCYVVRSSSVSRSSRRRWRSSGSWCSA